MKQDDPGGQDGMIKVRLMFKLCSNTSMKTNISNLSDEPGWPFGCIWNDQGKTFVLECFEYFIELTNSRHLS